MSSYSTHRSQLKYFKQLLFYSLVICSLTVFSQSESTKKDRATQNENLSSNSWNKVIESAETYILTDSLASLNALTQLTPNLSNSVAYDSICKQKVQLLQRLKKQDEALSFAIARQQYIKSSSEESDQLIRFNFFLSELHVMRFNYEKALELIESGMTSLHQRTNQTDLLGKLTYKAATLNYALGHYQQALELAFNAIDLFKRTNNNSQLALSYLQLGNIYYFLDNKVDAEEYYLLAKGYFKETDKYAYASCLSNLGLIKIDQLDFEEGIEYQMTALPLFLEKGNEIAIGNTYHYLSEAYLGLKQLDSAMIYVDKSMASNLKTKYFSGLSLDLLNKAKINQLKGDRKSAEKNTLRARKYWKKQPEPAVEKKLLYFMAELESERGDYKASFNNFKRFYAIEDSLKKIDSKLKTLALKQKSNLKQIHYELRLSQEREKTKTEKNEEQARLILFISIIAILSIVSLAFSLYFLFKNKSLNKELADQKNLIKNELQVKEALLGEIHHRVKNNLQIVSSILSLQSRYIENHKLNKVIDDCKGRIASMSLIHESLYQKLDFKKALFNKYVENLLPRLIDTYQVDKNQIRLKLSLEEIYLSLDESIPCGLIINEIVSNTLKHAFPEGQQGEISITLYKRENKVYLSIKDNGIGLNQHPNLEQHESFGFLLIDTLSKQLEADLSITIENGLAYQMSWISES